jgi:VCBS repeat-containing protein
MMLVMMLIFSCVASAAIIRPPGDTPSPGGGTSSGGSSGSSTDTNQIDHLELVVTVIKNEKPEVSGNLFGELDGLSLRLLNSPIGNYGFLDISAAGGFRYVIKNDLPQVQALGLNDVAQETFLYQIITTNDNTIDAKLTVYILGNPSVSFDNVEIEFNNNSNEASPIHAGSASQMGQYMRGQLTNPADRDWFIVNSLGNEIINLELCPEGSQCKDEKGWVMYVFDADKFQSEGNEDKTVTLRTYIDRTNETLSTTQANHFYLLYDKGFFNNSLIGIIDPCFGDRRTLDIGVGQQPKNYLVLITSPLFRSSSLDPQINNDVEGCGAGDVVLERVKAALPGGTRIIEQFITPFPFSDDQYTLRVTRTGADPFAVLSPDSVAFDAVGRKAHVARIRVNNQLFTAELEQLNTPTDANTLTTFGIRSIQSLSEPLTADPYLPTYNPVNQIVKFPQVLDTQSGAVYSVEMLYQPESNTLNLLRAVPVH